MKTSRGEAEFLVLIPAYNVAEKIGGTLRSVLQFVTDPHTVVVIDDGSSDATAEIVKQFGVVLLQHRQNRGKGAALKTGFTYASGMGVENVIVLDADGQHDPACIPEFREKARVGGYDLILGTRSLSLKEMPRDRWMSNQLTSLVLSLICGVRIRDSQCGYRFIRLRRFKNMTLRSDRYELESELLIRYARSGAKIGFLAVPTIYADEPSSMNRVLDTVRFMKMLIRMMFV